MSLKKVYIIYWVLNVIALLCVIPICFGIGNQDASLEWVVLPTVFFAFICLGTRLFVFLCFRCPYCGEKLYTTDIRLNLHLTNPWKKGCPHCGHDLH